MPGQVSYVWRYRLCLLFVGCIFGLVWSVGPACAPEEVKQESVGETPAAGESSAKEDAQEVAAEPIDASEPAVEPKAEPQPDGTVGDAEPKEAKPETTPDVPPPPKTLAIKEWFTMTSLGADNIRTHLEQGTFQVPTKEGSYLGSVWVRKVPNETGDLGRFAGNFGYAATTVKLDKPMGYMARIDTAFAIYVNGVKLPADVYGANRQRVPVVLKAGENVIVIHALGRRNKNPTAQFFEIDGEVAFNSRDITPPDLIVGETTEQCLGIPVLNLQQKLLTNIKARVVANEHFEETTATHPALPAVSVSHVVFQLKAKKPWEKEDTEVKLKLEVTADGLSQPQIHELTLKTIKAGVAYRRTRISKMDGSCQFYGVQPPSNYDPKKKYALLLSLHGAGVYGLGQARAYSQKDWAFVVAPTNRRRFGFDWEVFGQRDGLEALEHAMKVFPIDATKVHVTGHSMGGHGTWQFGVLFPRFFGVVAPSAGWSSFYSYTGRRRPGGIFARSQASSETNNYLVNLKKRSAYIIHGSADNNVPVREGRNMFAAVKRVTSDVKYHEEKDAGHWWNKKETPGADCVDLPDMMSFIKSRSVDPKELTFDFKTPGAWVSAIHSYATLSTSLDPTKDMSISSSVKDKTVTLTTTNVRAMVLDGKMLKDKGIDTIDVDGKSQSVTAGPINIGPQDGKKPGMHGPFNEVLYQKYCYIYPDNGPAAYQQYASYLTSTWAFIGNGLACSMPLSKVTDALRQSHHLIYLGIQPPAELKSAVPFNWDDKEISIDASKYDKAAIWMVYPDKGKLAGYIYATKGNEYLLFRLHPFSSSIGLPDYFVLTPTGGATAGLFDGAWKYDAKFRDGN